MNIILKILVFRTILNIPGLTNHIRLKNSKAIIPWYSDDAKRFINSTDFNPDDDIDFLVERTGKTRHELMNFFQNNYLYQEFNHLKRGGTDVRPIGFSIF